MKKFVGSLLGLLALSATFVACDFEETTYRDHLSAAVKVKKEDALTPVAHLPVAAYDWVTSFKDGSTVLNRFEDPSFVTDSNGAFNFLSADLRLQSGHLYESCTTVCVEETTYWEEQCSYWETECVEWDEDGYCTYEDTYCASYSWYPVTYCSAYGEDCEWYYPSRDVGDIETAYSEITYPNASEYEVVASPTDWNSATAYSVTTQAIEGTNDKLVTELWTQDDTFVTGINARPPVQGKPAKSKLARKRAVRPAVKIYKPEELETLTAKQKTKLEAARAVWGATKKK